MQGNILIWLMLEIYQICYDDPNLKLNSNFTSAALF